MERGGKSLALGALTEQQLMVLVRGGAPAYERLYGASFDRRRTERQAFPVSDDWQPPWGGRGVPERGLHQLGSLGGGNHFIELQSGTPPEVDPSELRFDTLHVQIHTGSRGFGRGLATNYFALAREERPELGANIDLGYFTPDSPRYRSYLDAVAAGANYAIVNRLILFEQIAEAFRKVFQAELELVYELSHNLVQAESHPELGEVWMHRKGATRPLPAGHPALVGTPFLTTGHPVLVPGSNKDESYILRPLAGAVRSLYSVNHGAGHRSRSIATSDRSPSFQRHPFLIEYRHRYPIIPTPPERPDPWISSPPSAATPPPSPASFVSVISSAFLCLSRRERASCAPSRSAVVEMCLGSTRRVGTRAHLAKQTVGEEGVKQRRERGGAHGAPADDARHDRSMASLRSSGTACRYQ